MNRRKTVALVSLFVLLVGLPVYAQVQSLSARTTVTVPFEFVAGNTTLPAGEYTIACVSPTVLKLSGPTTSVFVMINEKLTSQEVAETKLLFTTGQDGQHVLHQVWTEGQPHAHDIVHISTSPDVF